MPNRTKTKEMINAITNTGKLIVFFLIVTEACLGGALIAFSNNNQDNQTIISMSLIIGMIVIFLAVLFIIYKKSESLFNNPPLNGESQKLIDYEEERWKSNKARAKTIYDGIITFDIAKVKNHGTTREIDEIIDSYFSKNPKEASSLVKLFNDARDDSKGSLEDNKLTREFIACYFVTSTASAVRALLLRSDFRDQLFKSAVDDVLYVKVQLVRALSNTINKANMKECLEFVKHFIYNDNVLVSGFAYVFSLECRYVEFEALQGTWEQTYQDTKNRNLYNYLGDKNKRIRYVATNLAGYVNDQTSHGLLEENTHHEYDQVRICARSALAQRA